LAGEITGKRIAWLDLVRPSVVLPIGSHVMPKVLMSRRMPGVNLIGVRVCRSDILKDCHAASESAHEDDTPNEMATPPCAMVSQCKSLHVERLAIDRTVNRLNRNSEKPALNRHSPPASV
jgi:hypothetical protein